MEEWIGSVANGWMLMAMWLSGLALVFAVLVRLMPCNQGMYWWSDLRAVLTDSMYWFVVPLATRLIQSQMLLLAIMFFLKGKSGGLWPVKDLPLLEQCALMLLIEEVILYAMHRFFHTGWAWKVHAIHHSPAVLDWTATARFHPINYLLEFALADTVVLVMGFSPQALGYLIIFNLLYSSMVHANLNWTFGPLRHVLASPVFHRWHHTTEEAGLDKNFASTLPILDVICGTFYMPAGKLPENFGTGDADFPQGFWGQFFYPFRKVRVVSPPATIGPKRPAAARRQPRRRSPAKKEHAAQASA